MKITEILLEDSVRYILMLNGKPATSYPSKKEAEEHAAIVLKKLPNTKIEIKKQTTTTKSFPVNENLRKWFKEKWVRFNPQGKIMGPCARGSDKEGKPKCLPQSKAQALGKEGRASAARRKRKQDPNPERKGAAKNVQTKR